MWVSAWAALVVLLGVTRLAGLDLRLPHHDEMVHVWWAERLAFSGTYTASPAYHGPLLYHLEAGALLLFGGGVWQSRLVAALAGIGAVAALVRLAWLEAGGRTAAALAIVLTLSPSWLYYSRFNAHDTLILGCTAAVAWGRWHWSRGATTQAIWLVAVALALAWSTKLNALFLVGAIGMWPLVWRIARPRDSNAPPLPWPRRSAVAAALATAALLVAVLFASTYLTHTRDVGALDALARTWRAAFVDPVTYWLRLHQQERLGGPFHYYGLLLLLYEPLLVVGAVAALTTAWRLAGRSTRQALVWIGVGALAAVLAWPLAGWLESLLHVHPVHLVLLPFAAAAMWTMAREHGRRGDAAGVWWTWMAATQTLLYGYAGEKVPWLVVHVALPWAMIAAPALARAWEAGRVWTRVGLVALAALTAQGALAVGLTHRSDVGEPLVQLEYDAGTHAVLAQAARACADLARDPEPCVVTTPDALWPAEWYLRSLPGTRAVSELSRAGARTPFVFAPARPLPGATEPPVDLRDTHVPYPVRFSSWGTWVAWWSRPEPVALVRFWATRRPLGVRRAAPYTWWVRRDLAHSPPSLHQP